MYRLLFQGSLSGREPLVARDPFLVIGRDAACGLSLAENGVSDRHASIERREDGYYLADLDSATGVRVNDQPVTQHRLQSGDRIEIGSVSLQFELQHGVAVTGRRLDRLQGFALGAVGLILVAQAGVLAWIIYQPRPAAVSRSSAELVSRSATSPERQAEPGQTPPGGATRPAQPQPPSSPARQAGSPTAPQPQILNRMIRLIKVEEQLGPDQVRLRVTLRAQVGERRLDPSVTAVAVRFFVRADGEKTLPMRTPLWLNVEGLKNFSTRAFHVRFPGTPAQYAGYVIQTYYRGILQDVAAAPPALADRAPNPLG